MISKYTTFSTRTRTYISVALAGVMLATATSNTNAEQTVSLNFAGELDGKAAKCTTSYTDIGTGGSPVSIRDYRLFVSDVRLHRPDGEEVPLKLANDALWQNGDVALLDFEDGTGSCVNGTPQMNTTVHGTVPTGEYTGVSFTVGVPFEINHGDPTLSGSPLNLTSMFWNWRGGYKFIRMDFETDRNKATNAGANMKNMTRVAANSAPTGTKTPSANNTHKVAMTHGKNTGGTGWSLHLGSTKCASASKTMAPGACGNPNRIHVRLDNFDFTKNTVIIDPAAVLADSDLNTNAPETSPGCMSAPNDADCDSVLPRLGLNGGKQLLVHRR